MGAPGVGGQPTGFVLLFWAEAPARDQHLGLVRRKLGAQERKIARPVRHRAQQWVDVSRGEGGVQPEPGPRGRPAPLPSGACLVDPHPSR